MVVSPRPKVDGRMAVPRDVLVAVVLRYRYGNIQSDAASVIGNLSGDWLDCVAVSYWRRFV